MTYYICYDYAFSPVTEIERMSGQAIKKVLIVQKQDYFENFTPHLWD